MIAHTTSLAVSGGVYLLAQTALTSRLGDRLENRRDALLAASKLVGGIHALSVGCAALRILVDPKWQHNDLVQTPSHEGNRIVAWELGYLLSGMFVFSPWDARSPLRYPLLESESSDPQR